MTIWTKLDTLFFPYSIRIGLSLGLTPGAPAVAAGSPGIPLHQPIPIVQLSERHKNKNRTRIPIDGKIMPNEITARVEIEIRNDLADMYDFYHYCRKHAHAFFRGMSIEQFKRWNDQRIDQLARQPATESTDQARVRIEKSVSGMASHWDQDKKRLVFPSKESST